MSQTYTALDLSRQLAVPDSTIRSWAKRFPEFVGRTPGRVPRYTEAGRRALVLIRDAYADGADTATIRARLATQQARIPEVLPAADAPQHERSNAVVPVSAVDLAAARDLLGPLLRDLLAEERTALLAALRAELRDERDERRAAEAARTAALDAVLSEWRAARRPQGSWYRRAWRRLRGYSSK